MINTKHQPLYTIGITAGLLGVCQATLRLWEKKRLIQPDRIGKNRFYSPCDIDKLAEIKKLLREKHVNIAGVKSIIDKACCWKIKNCSLKEREGCPVYKRYRVFEKNNCCR